MKESNLYHPSNLPSIPDTSGLYYLYDDSKLLYIGKARKIRQRLKFHQKENIVSRNAELFLKLMSIDLKILSTPMINRVCYACLAFSEHLHIDIAFHMVTRIEIEMMPYELIDIKEKEMILQLRPILNHETRVWHEIDERIRRYDSLALACVQEEW